MVTSTSARKGAKPKNTPLKQACVIAARAVIAEQGLAKLSLREVARRLGVSHQAPYKHYPTHDEDAMLELRSLGCAYLDYARAHPLEYRLMFHTPWPEPAIHEEMMAYATSAYDRLRQTLMAVHGAENHHRVSRDALCIWSAMHGLASIELMEASHELTGIRSYGDTLREHLFEMLARGLQTEN
jgi:AcrR family transcriptional regulator